MMLRRSTVFIVMLGLGLGACGGSHRSVASFCSRVRKDHSHFADASTATGQAKLKALQGAAPNAIQTDLNTLVTFAADPATGKSLPSSADLTKLVAAAKHVEQYVKDQCKIDLRSTTSGGA